MRLALAILTFTVAHAADPEAGKRLYREGVLQSGSALEAIVAGDVTVTGKQWRCESCHRRSGMGGEEGGVIVSPVTGDVLFDDVPPPAVAHGKTSRVRPPYSERSLALALRQGVFSGGHALAPAMPRYRLSEEDVANLCAYLESLGRAPSPGVDDVTIHLATVITEGVDAAQRSSFLALLQAWFAQQNREADYQAQRRNRVAWHMKETYAASRRWSLDVWEPKGPPSAWTGQLAEFYRRQPVFAIIGGLANGPWQPIATFCDRFEIPCLFPETALPAANAGEGQTIYFSQGLPGEAATLAKHLRGTDGAVLQVYRESPAGSVAAAAFRAALPSTATVALPPEVPDAVWWQTALAGRTPAALIVWASDEDVRHLDCAAIAVPLYFSGTMLRRPAVFQSCPSVYVVSNYATEDNASRERARMKNWQLSRGIAGTDDRMELDTLFTLKLFDYSLARMGGRFSRDYLLETIERETERTANPGVFPRLSLGPGQRVASKGASIDHAR